MQSLEHKALAQTARPPFQERQQSMAPFYRGHRLLMLTFRQAVDGELGLVDDTYSRVVLLDDERASGRHVHGGDAHGITFLKYVARTRFTGLAVRG